MLRDTVNKIMMDHKETTQKWSIEKILKVMKVEDITTAIESCKKKIDSNTYSTSTHWDGGFKLYYNISEGKTLITLDKDDFDKNSKDRYFFEFSDQKQELRVLFNITCELSVIEKFEF